MRFLLIIVFIAIGLDCNAQASKSDIESLRYLKEVEWPKAYKEQDTVLLDRILADEFQMIDGIGGWFTKQDELAYIKENKPSYDSFEFEIKRLEIFENETAVVSGVGHIRTKTDEGEKYATYHSSNILIKRNGIWQAINSHVSGYKEH